MIFKDNVSHKCLLIKMSYVNYINVVSKQIRNGTNIYDVFNSHRYKRVDFN